MRLARSDSQARVLLEARKGTVSVFHGPRPQVLKLDDEAAEREAILGFLAAARVDGVVSDAIGLLVRSRA